MTKSAQVYKVGEKLIFIPMHIVNKIERTLRPPIVVCETSEDNVVIGKYLVNSLLCSSSGTDNVPENAFKELLKISKTKSNIRLVASASVADIVLEENTLSLELLFGDVKNKSFNGYKPRLITKLDFKSATNEEMGVAIISLFNQLSVNPHTG